MQDVCSCSEFEPLNTNLLQRALEITFDDEFTKQLIQARDTSGAPGVFCLSTLKKTLHGNHIRYGVNIFR